MQSQTKMQLTFSLASAAQTSRPGWMDKAQPYTTVLQLFRYSSDQQGRYQVN